MGGMMYVLGLVLAILAGFHVTRSPDWKGRSAREPGGAVDEAKTSFEQTATFRREGWKLYAGPAVFHIAPLVALVVVFSVIILIFDLTYAHYIGSLRGFLAYALGASVLGLLVSMGVRSFSGDFDLGDMNERIKGSGLFGGVSLAPLLVIGLIIVLLVIFGGAALGVCMVPVLLVLIIIALVYIRGKRGQLRTRGGSGARAAFKGRIIVPGRYMDAVRIAIAVFTLLMLVFSSFLAYITPSELTDNPLYSSLVHNHEKGDNPVTLEDPQEVRVVSWQLATEYLKRSYGDSAAFLDSSIGGLLEYTDPAYVNGRFVWVNAPSYEAWKWFGGKKVPFYVYVENDPANLTEETARVTHKVERDLEVHKTRITWAKRIEQLCFDRYAAKYEIAQVRFTMDDDENPYWAVYLAERDLWYNRLHLKRLLLINAMDMDDNTEYAVNSGDIPPWLEVVYPDEYVYEWVKFWAANRLGLGHTWFNKAHLYEPDDDAARFIVLNGMTYWQIPLVQKNSNVLGGYVWVDTRSGEATFFNRENKSLADKDTVQAQIEKYLSSGALGFQKLDIHEGYLYPIRLTTGAVREAYIFPLYAGLTVIKYAVVDAEDYTTEPYIENDLGTALDRYRGRSGGGGGDGLAWMNYTLEAGYVDGEEAVISVSNATLTNWTLVVNQQDLDRGLVTSGEDEMRELGLAVADWGRGEEVLLRLALEEGVVVDVDWEGSDLVP